MEIRFMEPDERAAKRREHLADFDHLALLTLAQEHGIESALTPHFDGKAPTVDELIELIVAEEADQIAQGVAEAERFRSEVDAQEIHVGHKYGPIKRYFSLSAPARVSKTAEWVLGDALPRWAEHFLLKNSDYGDQHATIGLGPAAEFVGMWRKMWKLKRALWEGVVMNGESPDEMLNDLIATCFLIKHLIALESGEAPEITQLGE